MMAEWVHKNWSLFAKFCVFLVLFFFCRTHWPVAKDAWRRAAYIGRESKQLHFHHLQGLPLNSEYTGQFFSDRTHYIVSQFMLTTVSPTTVTCTTISYSCITNPEHRISAQKMSLLHQWISFSQSQIRAFIYLICYTWLPVTLQSSVG